MDIRRKFADFLFSVSYFFACQKVKFDIKDFKD